MKFPPLILPQSEAIKIKGKIISIKMTNHKTA
jgi:hypothetical protein